ncbi:hypothetical protein UNDYM_2124 [Undibacterium sp. YM2]|uniref:hypothetical protein n=1 Tax=Undibacterium sp. YM2 TaxID=2058625 RepID=UPI001331C5CF|nr:hypothetical protein [Undibacterium sp. YM2]BBB66377.1 hypothetical protein UNDYM_2124 [Undibacterium sp. YM2]
MSIESTKKIKVISTNIVQGCEHGCTLPYNGQFFDANVNHYIQDHGYKVLHIGQESTPDSEGKPYHSTVAVLAVPV